MKLIKDLGMLKTKPSNKRAYRYGLFECPKCLSVFKTPTADVKSGRVYQCPQCSFSRNANYGDVGTPLYIVWVGIKQRCYNTNNSSYKYYGALGATVCDDWLTFSTFKAWAKLNNWSKGLHISRKGDRGTYSPSNCTIKSAKVNMSERNKAHGKLTGNQIEKIKVLSAQGKTQFVIAELFGVTPSAISYHVRHLK